MSETRGPFDAGIRILKGWIHMPEPDMTEIHNSVQVLEAAGKVDKEKMVEYFTDTISGKTRTGWQTRPPDKTQLYQDKMDAMFYALLESLPDKEET